MATSESLLSMCREITRPEYVVIGIYKPRLFPALSSTGINYKLTVLLELYSVARWGAGHLFPYCFKGIFCSVP